MLFLVPLCNACTGIGLITESGTLVGQNLDYYYYLPQKFELMLPIQQFNNWYENNHKHHNKFYIIYSIGPAGNGSAAISGTNTVTETNGSSCIYVSNMGSDPQP